MMRLKQRHAAGHGSAGKMNMPEYNTYKGTLTMCSNGCTREQAGRSCDAKWSSQTGDADTPVFLCMYYKLTRG